MEVLKTRKIEFEKPLKDTPFVDSAPTIRQYNLIEQTDHLLKSRVISKVRDVPYADYFFLDDEILCVMPPNCQSSCVLRITNGVCMVKSTLIKNLLISNNLREQRQGFSDYCDYFKRNGHAFKEKKKETKLSHGIEKTQQEIQE